MKTEYQIETIRSGQPRPYADTEREYLITVRSEQYGKEGLHPWLAGGDVEARIEHEEKMRAAGKMYGGQSPDEQRKDQREWAKKIVRALYQNFREVGDQDGKVEGSAEAHFWPTLKSLQLDAKAGTIRALIIEPYTD